jgi:short-chain fatty acids transporter
VVGALYAKELARHIKGVDYRLLIASAYSGFIVWHSGISGSIPLKLATAGPGLEAATKGAVIDPISTSLTIFSPFNLIIFGIILFTMPFVNRMMHPSADEVVTIDPKLLEDEIVIDDSQYGDTFANKMENSMILSMLIGAMGMVYVVYYFATNGFESSPF